MSLRLLAQRVRVMKDPPDSLPPLYTLSFRALEGLPFKATWNIATVTRHVDRRIWQWAIFALVLPRRACARERGAPSARLARTLRKTIKRMHP